MANEDFVNFENALRELQLSEEQLKRLVSEGEIRAIRGENNTMKFRRDEIERLKQDTGKTLQYTEESSETLTDDLLFDEADDLDVEDEGMTTAQISSEDTFVGDKVPPAKAPPRGAPAPTRGQRTPASAPVRGQTQSVRRTTGRSTRMRQTSAMQHASGIGMGVTAMLIVSFLVMVYASFVWRDVASNTMTSITRGVANIAGENRAKIPPRK